MAPSSTTNLSHDISPVGSGSYPQCKLPPGIYVPTVAFFKPDEYQQVDVEATTRHVQMLARAGVTGIVTHGSNGEAVHLNDDERMLATETTRQALTQCGQGDMTIVVGCGAASTQQTIKLCLNAAKSGGDFALVLPPSYYGSLLTKKAISDYFRAVADASPIPIVIYNFPAVQGGFDMTSDQIIELSKHDNIVGVKLTCGNTGKLARVAAATASKGFATMGGSADFLLPTLVAGGHGVIAGLGNLSPKAHVQAMRLYEKGRVTEAQRIAAILARGDWVAIQGGFIAVKVGLERFYDHANPPRLPCVMPEQAARVKIEAGFAEMMELESSLKI
jgi:dihydrodipicolinate synthase/N-acetylneuraminate lyase